MTPFELAIRDIFDHPDFAVFAIFRGKQVRCLSSAIAEDSVIGQFGIEDGITFALDVLCSDLESAPKRNELITYNGVEYRIDRAVLDSAATSWKIYLKSKNSP